MKIKLDKGAFIPLRAHETDAGVDLVDFLDDSERGGDGFGSTGK